MAERHGLDAGGALRLAYGPEAAQFGDLRLPAAGGPHPVAILIHGGFWRARYGLDLMDELGDDARRRELPGVDHMALIDPRSAAWGAAVEEVLALLARPA